MLFAAVFCEAYIGYDIVLHYATTIGVYMQSCYWIRCFHFQSRNSA